MTTTDWIQAIGSMVNVIMIGVLVAATWWYAKQTKRIAEATNEQVKATQKQADASLRMADEMSEQRYQQFQPVLDIEPTRLHGTDQTAEALAHEKGQLPGHIDFTLRNIGVGPALNVEAHIETREQQNPRFRLKKVGVIASGAIVEVPSFWSTNGTDVDERPSFYCATYHDIAKRPFTSKREILFAGDRWAPLGPLEYYPPEEDTP